MRIITLLSLAVAVAQVPALAAPQEPQEPQSTSSLSEIQVRSTMPTYQMQPAQLDEVKGVYRLDNGTIFRVTKKHRRLFAQLGDRKLTELLPLTDTRFVSPDQRITMDYIPEAFGDSIVLTYPSDLNLADARMVTVRFAVN